MKNAKRTLALVSAIALVGSLTACGSNGSSQDTTTATTTEATTTTAPKELDEEDKAAVEEVDIGEDENQNVGKIRWLSTYDINPDNGKPKLFALELFESKYGGSVEWIATTWENRYTDLANLVLAGDSPDLFPAQEFDTFPIGAVEGTTLHPLRPTPSA